MFIQPNPSRRRPEDLNERDREHYRVARTFTSEFTRAEFKRKYGTIYPHRNEGSIIPSDYCFNLDNRGNVGYPRFLVYEARNRYRFVGMDGRGDASGRVMRSPTPQEPLPLAGPPVWKSPPKSQSSQPERRFQPTVDMPRLCPDAAKAAIRAYNADSVAQAQERRAFAVLGRGFERGRIEDQLRGLDSAYSTRSVGSDLVAIAAAIEADFDAWTRLLGRAAPLIERTTELDVLRHLFGFFLEADTRRRPRSLATKALHFAAPRAFIPADEYAVNLLGSLLGAGSWSDTEGLGGNEMAPWYHGYLSAAHRLGIKNIELVGELVTLDAETATGPDYARVRGWPKLLDKMLWWTGRDGSYTEGLLAL